MIQQDSNGKWWAHIDGDSHFDPDLIGPYSGGAWRYDGALCESIVGPFDSEADAASRLASLVDATTDSEVEEP